MTSLKVTPPNHTLLTQIDSQFLIKYLFNKSTAWGSPEQSSWSNTNKSRSFPFHCSFPPRPVKTSEPISVQTTVIQKQTDSRHSHPTNTLFPDPCRIYHQGWAELLENFMGLLWKQSWETVSGLRPRGQQLCLLLLASQTPATSSPKAFKILCVFWLPSTSPLWVLTVGWLFFLRILP